MAKKMENETKPKKENETAKYYDNYINVWFRNYLQELYMNSEKTKKETDTEFGEKIGISYSKINRIISGYATFDANEIIKISDVTGMSPNDLLYPKDKVPDDVLFLLKELPEEISDDIKSKFNILFTDKAYNTLCKHSIGPLFPMRDNFLEFLNYMIIDEQYVDELSDTSKKILDEFKQNENIHLLATCKSYEEFRNKLSNKELLKDNQLYELSQKLNALITDKKIRNATREFIIRYIYAKLK